MFSRARGAFTLLSRAGCEKSVSTALSVGRNVPLRVAPGVARVMPEAAPFDRGRGGRRSVPHPQVSLARDGDHLELAVAVDVADSRPREQPPAGLLGPALRLRA